MVSNLVVFLFENPVSKRLIRLFFHTFRFRKDVKIKLGGQIMFTPSLDRIISLYLKKFSIMDASEAEFLKSVIKKGMKVVDVGSNIGYYTLIAADLIGSGGRVFSFEPDTENFRLLQKNISENNCQNIEAINLAVSDKTGKLRLFLSEENQGDHRIYDSGSKRQSVEVGATSLDDFLKDRPVDFIKIDVEGAEPLVFAGMGGVIKNNPKVLIMMEFWPHGLKMAGFSPDDFLKNIQNQGFAIYFTEGHQKELKVFDDRKLLNLCRGKNYINIFLRKTT